MVFHGEQWRRLMHMCVCVLRVVCMLMLMDVWSTLTDLRYMSDCISCNADRGSHLGKQMAYRYTLHHLPTGVLTAFMVTYDDQR